MRGIQKQNSKFKIGNPKSKKSKFENQIPNVVSNLLHLMSNTFSGFNIYTKQKGEYIWQK
jgi:hypothetical protein